MKDRIATNPGRVRLVPVPGQTNTYDMTMADNPTEQGTALNKGTLLSDATAALTDAEYGGTPDTPNEALALIAKGKVGTIVHSLSTDMGENYALCNGDFYDPTEYPDFAAMVSTTDYPANSPNYSLPADLPSGYLTDGFSNGIWGLYNGLHAAEAGTRSVAVIIAADGSGLYTVQPKNSEWASGELVGVEHNGSKYVILVLKSYVNLYVYTTTDFSSYTLEKTHTVVSSGSQPDAHNLSANFDGTYYYLLRNGSNSIYVTVLNTSFNLVREVTVPYSVFRVYMAENRAYGLIFDSSNSRLALKLLNGNPPTSISSYRTVAYSGNTISGLRIAPFNATYDILYYVGASTMILVPRNEASALQSFSSPDNVNVSAVFVSGDGNKLLVWSGAACYSCPITANPTLSASWTKITVGGVTWTNWSNSYAWYRHKTGLLPSKKQIVRAPLLPTITDDDSYVYVKIK